MAMIPYEVDPSLHPAEPPPPQLDDGFSRRAATQDGDPKTRPRAGAPQGGQPVEPALQAKSDF